MEARERRRESADQVYVWAVCLFAFRTAHLANPWGVNCATSNAVALPYINTAEFGATYFQAALPSWYPGI